VSDTAGWTFSSATRCHASFSSSDLRIEDWEEMIDINIKGVLHGHRGGAARLPETGLRPFRQHRFGGRTQATPTMAVYSAQVRGARDLRRSAGKSRFGKAARDRHLARLHAHKFAEGVTNRK